MFEYLEKSVGVALSDNTDAFRVFIEFILEFLQTDLSDHRYQIMVETGQMTQEEFKT